jgi:hypothetical protein
MLNFGQRCCASKSLHTHNLIGILKPYDERITAYVDDGGKDGGATTMIDAMIIAIIMSRRMISILRFMKMVTVIMRLREH